MWLAERAGLILDPWQEQLVRTGRTTRPDGKWAAFEVAAIVPRQNGKGSALEAVELDALFNDDQTKLILHSAHEFKTAYEAFRRIVGLIENSDLMSLVRRIRYTTGEEGIETLAGDRLKFVARSSGAGRGFSGDLIILDEAYNLTRPAISALLPTLSARPNPQIWYTSSAPLPNDKSDVLRQLIRRGRAATSPRLSFLEWRSDQDAALDDRAAWAASNPGLGIRLDEEVIEAELQAMAPEDFARERLGIYPDDDADTRVISAIAWAACRDEESKPQGPLCFALDVSPDRAWSTIVMAAESDHGGVHVEITGNDDVYDHRPGTAWLVARAAELQQRWGGKVAVAKGSPAWSLRDDLEDAKVDLLPISTEEHSQACGDLYDAVIESRMRHVGQVELDAAVAGADRRFYGDAWLWSRRASSVNISPLVAGTLAHWVAQKRQRKPKIW